MVHSFLVTVNNRKSHLLAFRSFPSSPLTSIVLQVVAVTNAGPASRDHLPFPSSDPHWSSKSQVTQNLPFPRVRCEWRCFSSSNFTFSHVYSFLFHLFLILLFFQLFFFYSFTNIEGWDPLSRGRIKFQTWIHHDFFFSLRLFLGVFLVLLFYAFWSTSLERYCKLCSTTASLLSLCKVIQKDNKIDKVKVTFLGKVIFFAKLIEYCFSIVKGFPHATATKFFSFHPASQISFWIIITVDKYR